MMRSLFSGVAGLKTHQIKMDVIGNNIANVNTVGYKSANVTFQDLVYQTKSNSSGPNDNTGRAGINAKQIGLGVSTASIYSNVTGAGSAETTGNPFDIRINGDSFFAVSDGNQEFYTRSGAFTVDANGTLCMSSNGYTVLGYQTIENADTGKIEISTASRVPLKILSPRNQTSDPAATTNGYITGIIDSNSDALKQDSGQVVEMSVFDNEGYKYTVKYKITVDNPPVAGVFHLQIADILDSNGKTLWREMDATDTSVSDYEKKKQEAFTPLLYSAVNNTSALTQSTTAGIDLGFDNTNGSATGPFKLDMTDAANQKKKNSDTVGFMVDLTALGSVADLDSRVNTAAFTKKVEVDTSTVQNIDHKGTSTVNGGNGGVDNTIGSGWSVGTMSSVSVSADGKITGSYTNGQTKLLGQIIGVTFSNASGLEKSGDNLYIATMNSGDPNYGDVTANGGSYASGELEMSNVDLSSEFTSMITTQRGFQANSRIITVSDTLLEELINLKR